ncbi:MAG TPA: serine hydrolase [Ktedonobacteraceae bacterium]|nr:serine hydrolase [Ktedonobacteraceae bacterium]
MSTQQTISQLHGFEDCVRTTMQDWHVPGIALTIVKDGEVIFSQGFGKRDVEHDLDVTPRTIFPIGSSSKAFTTMALALLADEGKLDWDTPVKEYMPSFKLYDTFATERMTPRDLVCHRSGLPRHDLMWYGSPFTRKEIFDRLRYLEPSKDFRTVWQYQNLMYMTAGYLVEQISGHTWEEFVRLNIFEPLEMSRSIFDTTQAQQTADFSSPYQKKDGEARLIPFYGQQWAVGPAGSIVSCIDDMSKWVQLHLNKGKHKGEQFVSTGQISQMHSPHMVIDEGSEYEELLASSYALGWFVVPYRGHTLIHHGGNIDGFSTLVSFLPKENIGVVVLTNLDANPLGSILSYNVYDRFLGLEEIPWSKRNKEVFDTVEAAGEKGKEKAASDRVPDTQPSHALDVYAGEYEHPGYGKLIIEQEGEQLQLRYNSFTGPLKHYHYDTFEFAIERFDLTINVSFSVNPKGEVDGLTAPWEQTVKDIVFKRIPRQEMMEKSFLEQFVGQYAMIGLPMMITVALKGEHALSLSLPGQPNYELLPSKGTAFTLKGLSGFSIEFRPDEGDGGMQATLVQPGGMFTARRQ